MTSTLDLVLIAVWIGGIVYVARQTTRKPPSIARTGNRGRRLRPRPGNGGMSLRFTPPPRYHPDVDSSTETLPDQLAIAMAGITPAMLCTLCVLELKQARAGGELDPEVHPGVVLSEVVTDGQPSLVVLCEVRHPLTVAPPPKTASEIPASLR